MQSHNSFRETSLNRFQPNGLTSMIWGPSATNLPQIVLMEFDVWEVMNVLWRNPQSSERLLPATSIDAPVELDSSTGASFSPLISTDSSLSLPLHLPVHLPVLSWPQAIPSSNYWRMPFSMQLLRQTLQFFSEIERRPSTIAQVFFFSPASPMTRVLQPGTR